VPKPSQAHPYSDRQAFERLILLIATLVRYPGIGSADIVPPITKKNDRDTETTTSIEGKGKGIKPKATHDTLEAVREKLQQVAREYGLEVNKCSIPTIRKDLKTLRDYGILDRQMYRWGYYLGTGAMTREELGFALNALASVAEYQKSPQVMRMYESLVKRLHGFDRADDLKLLYPVRSQINRAIVLTDLEDMASQQKFSDTLFHCLDAVESAILAGQALELRLHSNPYSGRTGSIEVYPLQILYHDIAWYLLYEEYDNAHFAVERIDRFADWCKPLEAQTRSIQVQKSSLDIAHKLLKQGWGLFLGEPEEQILERNGQVDFELVKVRFFTPVILFIEEGQNRHPTQKINPKGKPKFLDYQVELPPRSLKEFSYWVNRFVDNALVLSPQSLVNRHKQAAQNLARLYQVNQ